MSSGRISRIRGALTPGEWARAAAMTFAVIGLHVIGWGALLAIVVPRHYSIGTQTFGVGIGLTAYTLGARHAFDADHISAIDNTTRKLMADGKRPLSVGFWFSLGHSSVVFALSLLQKFASANINLVTAVDLMLAPVPSVPRLIRRTSSPWTAGPAAATVPSALPAALRPARSSSGPRLAG